jgi:hypothetical protein
MMSIFILPHEVLRAIFSFLPPYDRVRFTENGIQHDLAQLLILKTVSRRFRTLFYDLGFWHDDNSDFSRLLTPNYCTELQSVRFFWQLYNDENLAQCFSRKPGWTFSTLASLVVLIPEIPLFYHNARRIALMLDDEVHRSAAIRLLAHCHHITTLSLKLKSSNHNEHYLFDLSSIAQAFPVLESLTLTDLCPYEESLDDINLECLAIRGYGGLWDTPSFIPFNSARTLVKLSIVGFQHFDFDEENPLDSLPNLRDLELMPFADGFPKVLITTKIKLLHFTTEIAVAEPTLEEVSEVFSSPCFRRLQKLTLNQTGESGSTAEDWIYNEEIVILITRHLRTLRTLELLMTMDRAWCSSFADLSNLKTLTWHIRKDEEGRPLCMDGSDLEEGTPIYLDRGDWVELRAKTVEKFQRAFANFEQKPRIIIDLNCPFDDKYYGSAFGQL